MGCIVTLTLSILVAPLVTDAQLATKVYRIGRLTASASTRWNLSPSPGGGDAAHSVAHGTRADIRLEQNARTGHRRRVFVEPRTDAADVTRALRETVALWQAELPGTVDRFAFSHALIRTTLYEELNASRRSRLPMRPASPGPR
jgi:hypothetical protein